LFVWLFIENVLPKMSKNEYNLNLINELKRKSDHMRNEDQTEGAVSGHHAKHLNGVIVVGPEG
jgi:hypothetical protein